MLEEILMKTEDEDIEEDWKRIPHQKDRFDAFVFWLSANDCNSEEKEDIKETFDISHFSVKELLTDVKNSGLYPIEEIHKGVLEIYHSDEEEMEVLRNMHHVATKSLKEKNAKIKALEQEIDKLKEDNEWLLAN